MGAVRRRTCHTRRTSDRPLLPRDAWTPTEERIALFDELTADASFPCQWDSDAFIAGLADRYPETMQRFVHGEAVLEQFISQRAMLASSPVERGESLTMLEAIETRQDALDAIRDTVSENYQATMMLSETSSSSSGPPHQSSPSFLWPNSGCRPMSSAAPRQQC